MQNPRSIFNNVDGCLKASRKGRAHLALRMGSQFAVELRQAAQSTWICPEAYGLVWVIGYRTKPVRGAGLQNCRVSEHPDKSTHGKEYLSQCNQDRRSQGV